MAVKAKAKARASTLKPAKPAAQNATGARRGATTASTSKPKTEPRAATRSKAKARTVAKPKESAVPVTDLHVGTDDAPRRPRVVETDPVWIRASEDYANPTVRVSDIAERLGMSRFQIVNEAKRRGWPPRTPKTQGAPAALLQHVFGTIKGELKKLDCHAGTSSQDRERASRALSQMVNSLEKAVEMQRTISKTSAKGGKSKDKELAHAEDLRRAIAERLERLNSKRDAGKEPPASE